MPDLAIDVCGRHVADDAVLEVKISGHHLGVWRGLPPTGRPVRFPLCGIFTFDDEDRLAGEKIYYHRAAVLQQLGVFQQMKDESEKSATVLTREHPVRNTVISIAKD
jgi:SnoaL-like polyketide cyclase